MSVAKVHHYKEVTFFELGYALFGNPFISVMSYYVDGLLVDTGPHKMQNSFDNLLKNYPIQQIVLSHHHEDHSGNAEYLRKKYNIPVKVGKLSKNWLTQGFHIYPYQVQSFGKMIPIQEVEIFEGFIQTPNHTFEVIYTPGHSPDHYSFLEKSKGWLFSGDLYIGNLKYMRSDENMGKMINSLKKVLNYDFEVLFCAHRPRLKNGKSYIKEKLEYLENFYGEVINLHQKGYSNKSIMKSMQLKEKYLIKIWSSFDVSVENMIKAVINPQERLPSI